MSVPEACHTLAEFQNILIKINVKKILQRVVLLLCAFYAGLHLTAMGLASKLSSAWVNYAAIGLGILLMLCAIGYCIFKCVVKYIALTSKKRQNSESE
ncbi:hypothetical protein PQ465_13360 [Sphingobacterium oryzagri]|uniref:Uncharacterized protein n=1 Tax=Sphingobacterium oryzagri TaxID=3025669 RepID=A0ABY7WCT1_9SPHI|nr:hypothetical protein [Sphingobacterium sp. KACC 22765]WDF67292.1 hypothetical protein PQ465_13360 [Sphingobacterium sp. KACC 22765]